MKTSDVFFNVKNDLCFNSVQMNKMKAKWCFHTTFYFQLDVLSLSNAHVYNYSKLHFLRFSPCSKWVAPGDSTYLRWIAWLQVSFFTLTACSLAFSFFSVSRILSEFFSSFILLLYFSWGNSESLQNLHRMSFKTFSLVPLTSSLISALIRSVLPCWGSKARAVQPPSEPTVSPNWS